MTATAKAPKINKRTSNKLLSLSAKSKINGSKGKVAAMQALDALCLELNDQGVSLAKIAGVLGVTGSSIHTRVVRARRAVDAAEAPEVAEVAPVVTDGVLVGATSA